MHGLIRDRLEEYLGGRHGGKMPPELQQHLLECEECREELGWMQEQSLLLRSLAPAREVEPAAGFYARVIDRIESQRPVTFWNAFLDPSFGRRVTVAALAMVVLMFGFLAFSGPGLVAQPDSYAADFMMSSEQQPRLGVDRDRDREAVFVTLATYRE